jgi:hypothetical protein
MQALVDIVPPEDADFSPPAESRLLPQDVQWDLLSQPSGSIEAGTRGRRITEWLEGVGGGDVVTLDDRTVVTSGEINSALRVRMGAEVSIGLQPRHLCRRWYAGRHRSLGQSDEVGNGYSL